MGNIIRAEGLRKSFGDIIAVDGIDLDVKSGSVLGLIGPNGAGKTTFLRALLGLTQYKGNLDVLGNSPRRQRAQLMEQVCFMPIPRYCPGG